GHLLGTGPGDDYLAACRAAAGNRDAQALADGVAAVLTGLAPSFSLDYAWRRGAPGPGGRPGGTCRSSRSTPARAPSSRTPTSPIGSPPSSGPPGRPGTTT